MSSQVLMFIAPNRPLSINEANKMHWAARKRRLDPWRTLTEFEVRARYIKPKTATPVRVSITLPFSRSGRRDPHNYTSTVGKTIVDALVAAGVVPDDTAEWVEFTDPVLAVDAEQRVYIEIEERQ
jgi:Holliday junction resolvase RusA-like endonuclease